MSQYMTHSFVAAQLGRLKSAGLTSAGFKANAMATIETYFKELDGVTADALEAAVTRSIREDEYFPKVARLRAYARAWQDRNQAEAGPVARMSSSDDDKQCPQCGEAWRWPERWRPKLNARGRLVFHDDGRVLLEVYHRCQCRCSTPCAYEPEPDLDGPPRMWPKAGTELARRAGPRAALAETPT